MEVYVKPAVLLLLIIILFVVACSFIVTKWRQRHSANPLVSAAVLEYAPLIKTYAEKHGIEEYEKLIQAVMMQESGGKTSDPMQCSECMFNTRYENKPGAIEDPEYSIDVGIRYLAYCLDAAGCTGPEDMPGIRLALQGYNYGAGYIDWAVENYGDYSQENAEAFANMMKTKKQIKAYGDTSYVSHVLRYYGTK